MLDASAVGMAMVALERRPVGGTPPDSRAREHPGVRHFSAMSVGGAGGLSTGEAGGCYSFQSAGMSDRLRPTNAS